MHTPSHEKTKEQLIEDIVDLKNRLLLKEKEISRLNKKLPSLIENSQTGKHEKSADAEDVISEDMYRIISELTSDFAYAFRIEEENELKYEWGFGALEKITGYSREELKIKGGWETILFKDDRYIATEQFNQLLKGKSNTFEYRIIDKNGKILWVRDYAEPIVNNRTGKVEIIYGAIQDITERKEVEESLRFANLVLENSPAVLFRWKAESGWPVEYVSQNINQFGYSQKELLSQEIQYSQLIHPEDFDRVNNEVKEFSSTGVTNFHQEYRILCKDGRVCWTDDRTKIERNEDGIIEYYQGIVLDITDKKNIEFALRESEKQYKLLFSGNPNSMIVFDRSSLKFLDANDAAVKQYGYEREEFLSMTIKDIRPMEDIEKMQKVIDGLNGKITIARGFRHKKKNGDIIYVDTIGSEIKFNGKNAQVVVINDITEKFKAKQAIKESEDKFKSVFTDSHDCIYVTSSDGKILNMNNAGLELFGIKEDELSKFNIANFYISLQERENFRLTIDEAGFVKNYPVKLRNKKGDILDCLVTASLRKDSFGKVASYQGIVRDITDEKKAKTELIKAKEQAEKADRLKTEFLAQMSHEIRTPINTLLSFSSLIREETKGINSEELDEYFNYQTSAGKRIIRTIDLVLNMSEVQTGSFQLNLRELNLVELVSEIFNDYKNIAEENGLKIIFLKSDDDIRIKGDDYSVHQIFSNLLDNSVKYTPGGEIILSIYQKGEYAIVEVKDSGIGIAKEYLDSIFHPFTQEEQGYTRRFEGSGLGLSLVKKYCEYNDAKISVESAKNVGTKFKVSFELLT